MLTFTELAAREPRLTRLESVARTRHRSVCDGCELDIWHKELKPNLTRLIGYGRESDFDPDLMSSDSFSVATQHLLKLVPRQHGRCDRCGEKVVSDSGQNAANAKP